MSQRTCLLRGPHTNPDSISARDVVLVSSCPLASTDAHILKRKVWKKLSSGKCIGILPVVLLPSSSSKPGLSFTVTVTALTVAG